MGMQRRVGPVFYRVNSTFPKKHGKSEKGAHRVRYVFYHIKSLSRPSAWRPDIELDLYFTVSTRCRALA